MSLEYVLLAMLRSPASGYDLKADFESGAKYFWSAEYGQIYPTLQALEKKGWLASQQQISDKGPPRKVYRRTAKGTAEFHTWLRSGPAMGTERFAWIAQLIYLGELSDLNETTRFLETLLHKQSALRDVLRAALLGLESDCPKGESQMNDEQFHEWLALQFGIRAVEARLDWCQHAKRTIRRRLSRQKRSKPKRNRQT